MNVTFATYRLAAYIHALLFDETLIEGTFSSRLMTKYYVESYAARVSHYHFQYHFQYDIYQQNISLFSHV